MGCAERERNSKVSDHSFIEESGKYKDITVCKNHVYYIYKASTEDRILAV